jgi:phage terminase Nu1 subunit (DNA packaging protein)
VGEVIALPATLLTVNAFAGAAVVDHATITRRLKAADIEPHSKKGKQALFRLRDLLHVTYATDEYGRIDADKLTPFARRAHYQSEMQKLKLEEERGTMIPAIEVEQEQARVAKIVVRFLETLPDVLERDHSLSGAVVSRVQANIDALREEIYEALIAPASTDAAVTQEPAGAAP